MTRQEIVDWVLEEFGTQPEYLWEKYPDCAVQRNKGSLNRQLPFNKKEVVSIIVKRHA